MRVDALGLLANNAVARIADKVVPCGRGFRLATKLKPKLMAKLDATVKRFFSNESVSKTDIMQSVCDEAMDTCAYPVIKVVAKGPLPKEIFRNWKANAAEHPTVVKVEVEKILHC